MSKELLVVIDAQNDFIDGVLGTSEAAAAVPRIVSKIEGWDGDIILTQDTHKRDTYMETNEGRHLPVPHCCTGEPGREINKDVMDAVKRKVTDDYIVIRKGTFGSLTMPEIIKRQNYMSVSPRSGYDKIVLIGFCTDICVISNTLILKANFPEDNIVVDVSCCAGVTPETHKAAIAVMKMCQIDIEGEE